MYVHTHTLVHNTHMHTHNIHMHARILHKYTHTQTQHTRIGSEGKSRVVTKMKLGVNTLATEAFIFKS